MTRVGKSRDRPVSGRKEIPSGQGAGPAVLVAAPGDNRDTGSWGLWPARPRGFVSLSLSALLAQGGAGWGRDRLGGLFTVCMEIVKIKEGFE